MAMGGVGSKDQKQEFCIPLGTKHIVRFAGKKSHLETFLVVYQEMQRCHTCLTQMYMLKAN